MDVYDHNDMEYLPIDFHILLFILDFYLSIWDTLISHFDDTLTGCIYP